MQTPSSNSKPSATFAELDALLDMDSPNPEAAPADVFDFDQVLERSELWDPGDSNPIDYRIRQVSYSSLLTLHNCPRKYQLSKLQAQRTDHDVDTKVTFAFGHAVGHAIQQVLLARPVDQIIWEMFLQWPDGLESHSKKQKSLWEAIVALQKFVSLREAGLLEGYQVLEVEGQKAIELSFAIILPDGFRYRGHVDVVLQHSQSGAILVLELKTTGAARFSPASYKNSAQAIGYSIILDSLAPAWSSYEVLYLIYQTESREYSPIPFRKSHLQRARWIRELMMDIEAIKQYEAADLYPMRGESCYSFFRECDYLAFCSMETDRLTKPLTTSCEDRTVYTINTTLLDLIEAQESKAMLSHSPELEFDDELL